MHLEILHGCHVSRFWMDVQSSRLIRNLEYMDIKTSVQEHYISCFQLTSNFLSCSICFMCFAMTVSLDLWSSFNSALSSFWLRAKSENIYILLNLIVGCACKMFIIYCCNSPYLEYNLIAVIQRKNKWLYIIV